MDDGDCLVCMSAARAVRLPCGHCSTCETCTGRMEPAKCPVCRAPFKRCRLLPPALAPQPTFEELTASYGKKAVPIDAIAGHECPNLGVAASKGHEQCIQRAIDAGADVNARFTLEMGTRRACRKNRTGPAWSRSEASSLRSGGRGSASSVSPDATRGRDERHGSVTPAERVGRERSVTEQSRPSACAKDARDGAQRRPVSFGIDLE